MDHAPELALLPAAARFLEFEGARAPDFSACLVLVPHHHAGQDFRRALRHALPHPVLLPPRLLTLPEWAGGAPLGLEAEPASRRLAELHEVLRKSGQVPHDGLWQAARELLELMEELDEADTDLDANAAAEALRRQGANPYLGIEAAIAQAVWRAYRHTAPGRARAYGEALARLAASPDQPIYTLGLAGLSRRELACLDAWGKRQAVRELPTPAPYPQRHALLHAAWRQTTPMLAERAQAFAAIAPHSPLSGALGIHPAHNLESAARVAEQVLLDWLGAGLRKIALLALDRLLARRLRALLERRGILMQDETGWAFSTSAVSHVLERCLALAAGPVWHGDLLDLFKSPFIFAATPERRRQAVHELEDVLRRHGAPAELAGYESLAREHGLDAAAQLLARLTAALRPFAARRQSLAGWTRALLAALDQLDATTALGADPIGRQLLDLLARLGRETTGFAQRFDLGDWRRWLFLHLEQSTFSDVSVESPLRLTHLAATHHRALEGVLILGAGAAHLPGKPRTALFNDATRRQLGLADASAREAIAQDMLIDLVGRVPRAAFIWQAEADGDPAPLSPWLLHLDAFHRAAWHESLIAPLEPVVSEVGDGVPVAPPTPRAPAAPQALSVSAWQSLVSCPYQYFARHILGLNAQDDLPEEMDKAEYGSLVHRILARFHAEARSLCDSPAEHWVAHLTQLSTSIFAPAERRNYQASAWRRRWLRHVPDYVAWAMARESEGWRFVSAETPLERVITWAEAGQTRVHGRADRIDRRDTSLAVLDYKTQSRQTLNAKLGPSGEDVQLAVYTWLAQADQAGFVTVDEAKVALLQGEQDAAALAARAQAEAARIAQTLSAIAAGQPLPAHGAPGTCAWCEMQGLCRRAHQTGAVP